MIRSSSSVGFPEPRERGPKVRDWPLSRGTISLNDETRFSLPSDWRTDFSPVMWRRYATSSPGTALSQQTRGDVQADLQQLNAFQRGATVADMLREIPEHASPSDGAAS